jgi:uncharacterized BrkB/YihY/UPF0761 family membrane protein
VLLATAAPVVAGPLNVLVFLTAFRVLPNTTISWSEALPGAIVAGIAIESLKVFGAMYLEQGAQARNETFGSLRPPQAARDLLSRGAGNPVGG